MIKKEIKANAKAEISLAISERKSLKSSVKSLIASAIENEGTFYTLCVINNKDMCTFENTLQAESFFSIKATKAAIIDKYPLVEKLAEGGVCFLSTRTRYFGSCNENVTKVFTPVVVNDYLAIIKATFNNCVANYVDTCNGKKNATKILQTEAHVDAYYTDKACTKVFDISGMKEYKKTKEGFIAK